MKKAPSKRGRVVSGELVYRPGFWLWPILCCWLFVTELALRWSWRFLAHLGIVPGSTRQSSPPVSVQSSGPALLPLIRRRSQPTGIQSIDRTAPLSCQLVTTRTQANCSALSSAVSARYWAWAAAWGLLRLYDDHLIPSRRRFVPLFREMDMVEGHG